LTRRRKLASSSTISVVVIGIVIYNSLVSPISRCTNPYHPVYTIWSVLSIRETLIFQRKRPYFSISECGMRVSVYQSAIRKVCSRTTSETRFFGPPQASGAG
jgi:hypothetical protein